MATCKFKTEDVVKCITHALNNGASELYFVHDKGIYLMTKAKRTDEEIKNGDYIAYAEGCNPHKDEDYYQTSRDLVGGDDFAENIPVTAEDLTLCQTYREYRIKISRSTMSIEYALKNKLRVKLS